jgi:hypothetical protein
MATVKSGMKRLCDPLGEILAAGIALFWNYFGVEHYIMLARTLLKQIRQEGDLLTWAGRRGQSS